jgi:epsin
MQQQQQQQQQQQLQLQAQQEEWMRQQLAQQQTAQQQALLAQQQHEFLAAQTQQQARLVPQPTSFGFVHRAPLLSDAPLMTCANSSNNPFAITTPPAPPVSSPQQPVQSSFSNFTLPSTYESHEPPPRHDYATPPPPRPQSQPAPAPSPQPTPKRSQTRADQEHAHLASLFAARDGDGIDTFGNVGALRYAARSFFMLRAIDVHAMVFFRRFGQSEYGKLAAQKTGAVPQNSFNPFAPQQQQQQQQQQQTHNNEQPFFTI